MKKSAVPKRSSAKPRGGRRKVVTGAMNEATTEEFEREDMGIAPKE